MKHKYVFVRDVLRINQDSVIFHVWVPESDRGLAAVKFLMEFSSVCNAWFEKWSEVVDARLDYYEERVFWYCPKVPCRFRVKHVSAAMLVQAIRQGNLLSLEKSINYSSFFFKMCAMFYPSQSPIPTAIKKSRPLLTSPRKNLSLRRGSEVTDAVVGLVGVVVLYFIGMIIDAIERVCL